MKKLITVAFCLVCAIQVYAYPTSCPSVNQISYVNGAWKIDTPNSPGFWFVRDSEGVGKKILGFDSVSLARTYGDIPVLCVYKTLNSWQNRNDELYIASSTGSSAVPTLGNWNSLRECSGSNAAACMFQIS